MLATVMGLDVSDTNLLETLGEYAFLKHVDERRLKLSEENALAADLLALVDVHLGIATTADAAGLLGTAASQYIELETCGLFDTLADIGDVLCVPSYQELASCVTKVWRWFFDLAFCQ